MKDLMMQYWKSKHDAVHHRHIPKLHKEEDAGGLLNICDIATYREFYCKVGAMGGTINDYAQEQFVLLVAKK